MILKAVIIDDEAPARDELEHLLDEIEGLEVVARCKNGIEGIRSIHTMTPDLAFVDVCMPGLDGFEMLGLIDPDKMPSVVFVTAVDDQAVRAFEEGAYDYIVKPVRPDRLAKAIGRVRERHHRPELEPTPVLRIPCVSKGRIRLIPPEAVIGAFTDATGVHLVTADGSFDTDLTLRVLVERLGLFRCHRQHAVALSSVVELALPEDGGADVVLHGGHRAPVGRRHLKSLREHLGIGDLRDPSP